MPDRQAHENRVCQRGRLRASSNKNNAEIMGVSKGGIVVLDFESTGLRTEVNHPTEIAVVIWRKGALVEQLTSRLISKLIEVIGPQFFNV